MALGQKNVKLDAVFLTPICVLSTAVVLMVLSVPAFASASLSDFATRSDFKNYWILKSAASDQERGRIDVMLDKVFNKSQPCIVCPKRAESINVGRTCLEELAKSLEVNGSNVIDCRVIQVEYDCIAKSVDGCGGGQGALDSFYQAQQESFADPHNCTIQRNSTLPNNGDFRNFTILGSSKSSTKSLKRSKHSSKHSKHSKREHSDSEPTHHCDCDNSQENAADTEYAVSVALNTASVLFVWIPQAAILYSFEE